MLVLESESLSLVLIHIPKTGGTTLRKILEDSIKSKFLGTKINLIINCPSPVVKRPSPYRVTNLSDSNNKLKTPVVVCCDYWQISDGVDLAHVPYNYFNNYYPPPGNFNTPKGKFSLVTSVRNPYDRIYSAYCWHNKENGIVSSISGFHQFVKNKLSSIINDFNRSLEENVPPQSKYIHFIPMWMMLYDTVDNNVTNISYFIRQETFYHDVDFLMNDLGLPWCKNVKNSHCRTKEPPIPYLYMKCYDTESKKIIESLYEKDFIIFGYRLL